MTRTDTPEGGEDELVPVFVYGTLRFGEGNYAWCQNAVRYVLRDCRANGRIYFVFRQRGFPVAKLDEDGEIVGDILWFDPTHPDYEAVVRMELNAGYEMVSITVRCEGGEHRDAFGFHYTGKPEGCLIPDGDWVAASNRGRITRS